MEFLVHAICAFAGGFAGAFVAARLAVTPVKEVNPTRERRSPSYNTPSKAAAYLAGNSTPKNAPSNWIKP